MIFITHLISAPQDMEVDTEAVKTNRLGKNARLEARVTIEQKQLLERAAGLRGQNLTEFMISVLADAATQTILDSELIALTDRDRQAFAAALLNQTDPSEQAISDAQWYAQVNLK
jgi:uncharacterized protein (DUF1778 family)